MTTETTTALTAALRAKEQRCLEAVDRLRDEDHPDAEAWREAVELIGCLRRLVQGSTVREIHRAFGAPGDFGYETPIGQALAAVYHEAASAKADERR